MTEVQCRILEIYKEVFSLCKRNSINFYAIGGTCIGAVRHNGFIPWDDDIDIAIPIEEYNRFITLCRKELPEYLAVISPSDFEHSSLMFCKITDCRTTFIGKSSQNYSDAYTGVFVDVMPLAGVPNNSVKKRFYITKLNVYYHLNVYRRFGIPNTNSFKVKMVYKLLYPFIRNKPFTYFYLKYLEIIKANPAKDSTNVGYVWSPKLIDKLTFNQVDFSDFVQMKFEDTYMLCPIGYDDFLTTMFGDYMQLPPEDKRISGHVGFVDLNTPYKKYQEQFEKGEKMPWKN